MIFRLPPPLLPFLPRAKYDIFIHARLSFVNRDGKYHVERTSSYFRIKIRFQLLFFILIFLILITWNSISSHSFNSNLETSLSKYSLKKSFYQNTTKFFQTRISKIPLSKIYLSSFSSFLFFFILISSTIFSRSRFEFDRSLHDHPSKRWIVRYDAPNDILCSNNSRVFHSLAGELA